jgi:hypothetical protein
MSQASLNNILQQLPALTEDELRRIEQAVRDQLEPANGGNPRDAVYAALRARGLLKQIKKPKPSTAPPLVAVEGKPISQTIIEERR